MFGPCIVSHVLSVLSSCAIILLGKRERADCLTFIVFWMLYCYSCYLHLPHGAVGWSEACVCGIVWSYSFAVWFDTNYTERL